MPDRTKFIALGLLAIVGGGGMSCATTEDTTKLGLDRVVLYRNGIGYFERAGEIDGDRLRITCRKDQVNDLLKSLTIVDRSSGQALSVSMPLDPQSWANAAFNTLAPGRGQLADILDALRGTNVTLSTTNATVSGRILMVEQTQVAREGGAMETDHRVSVIDHGDVEVVWLSKVEGMRFEEQDIVLGLQRSLDASQGEGMFQTVEVEVRLSEASSHDVLLSYVVEAPIWKPTYRVVLPKDGKSPALLQAWAVVDNTSGEDWGDVSLSLTSGAPLAFRYDLHTPRTIQRPDLSGAGTRKRAQVAMGETTIRQEAEKKKMAKRERARSSRAPASGQAYGIDGRLSAGDDFGAAGDAGVELPPPMDPPMNAPSGGFTAAQLASSTTARTQAKRISGLTQFELTERVTVPDGTSTMVAILNSSIKAEQVFLYRPGGAGSGYENNPYRVVRFHNETPYVLEPGPISIYSGGSFVGEGISEAIAAETSATIPFAVEPAIIVQAVPSTNYGEQRLIKVVKGVMTTETFHRRTTTYTVRAPKEDASRKILVRHTRYGAQYELKDRVEDTEELPGAYMIPIILEANKTEVAMTVVEQSPTRSTVAIWDGQAVQLLETFLSTNTVNGPMRRRIEPILTARKEIADIDRDIGNLKKQQREYDDRADQTRRNLEAIKKDPAATALRAKLNKRLDEFTKSADSLGRKVIEKTSLRLEKKINLEELLEKFTFEATDPKDG